MMSAQFESFTWVQDESGNIYTCCFNDSDEHSHAFEELSEEEKKLCSSPHYPWN